MVECTRLESEQTVTGLGSSNLPLSEASLLLIPLAHIRSVVIGTADAVTQNGSVIDRKARDLNRTMAVLFGVVVIVIPQVRGVERR